MDYALPYRRAAILMASERKLTPDEQLHITRLRLTQKRANARAYLGEDWILHPAYRPELHTHHQPGHKDSTVLKRVADNARQEGRL